MSDDTNPLEDAVEQALDAFVYAPIGLVFEGPALFPSLVEKGRNQVKVARIMGEMAVQMGQKEATKRAKTAQEQMRGSLAAMGLVPTPGPETAGSDGAGPEQPAAEDAARAKEPTAKKRPATKKRPTRKQATTTKKKTSAAKTGNATSSAPKKDTGPKPSPEGLGIPDYDSLSASQVVSRLRGLGADELDHVKDYESATRARKTILNKITQLQKD